MEDCTDHHELGQDHHHHCRLRCSGIFESLNAQLMAVTSLVSVHLLRVVQRPAEKYPWRLIFYVVVSWVLSSCLVTISVFLEFYHPLSHKSELPRIFDMTASPIKAKAWLGSRTIMTGLVRTEYYRCWMCHLQVSGDVVHVWLSMMLYI